jgi:uncharacterized membrane protein YbhN (UPF0104 family)
VTQLPATGPGSSPTVREGSEPPGAEHGRRIGWRGLLQLALGLAALAVVFLKADAGEVIEALRRTRPALLPLAVLASFVVTWLMALRWGLILSVKDSVSGPLDPSTVESSARRAPLSESTGIPTSKLFAYYLVGVFFTNFIPGGGVSGDIARLIYVDREIRDKPFVLSTLVYERLVGVFVLLLIGLVATIFGDTGAENDRAIGLVEGALLIAFVTSAALMSRRVSRLLSGLVERLSRRFKLEHIGAGIVRTLGSISRMRFHGRMLAGTLALSIAIRIVWSLGCYCVSRAMGLPLNVVTVFSFISLVDLIRLMPISVGGLGVREWVMVGLFAGVGLSREQALTYSLLAFAPIYINAIAGGTIYLWLSAARQRRNHEEVRTGPVET